MKARALIILICLTLGCEQQTKPIQEQTSGQRVAQDTQTLRDGATQANIVALRPKSFKEYTSRGMRETSDPDAEMTLAMAEREVSIGIPEDEQLAGTVNNYITIRDIITNQTDGSTGVTPGLSGVGQTPTASQTATATQEPTSTAAVPITVSAAPGSTAQGGPTNAAGGEGDSTTSQTAEQRAEAMQQEIRAMKDQIAEIVKALQIPTTQQADEGNGE